MSHLHSTLNGTLVGLRKIQLPCKLRKDTAPLPLALHAKWHPCRTAKDTASTLHSVGTAKDTAPLQNVPSKALQA